MQNTETSSYHCDLFDSEFDFELVEKTEQELWFLSGQEQAS